MSAAYAKIDALRQLPGVLDLLLSPTMMFIVQDMSFDMRRDETIIDVMLELDLEYRCIPEWAVDSDMLPVTPQTFRWWWRLVRLRQFIEDVLVRAHERLFETIPRP